MVGQPEIRRPHMAVVSDLHLEVGQRTHEKLHSLVTEIIARPDISLFILPGDVVNNTLLHEGASSVAAEFARLNAPEVGRKISTIYVEGNDEQHMDREVREQFYHQLEKQGVLIFKAGENNYTTVKDEHGQDIAAVIGVPWTLPPEQYSDEYLNLNHEEQIRRYRQLCEEMYIEPFLGDLQHAHYQDLPTYIVFHAPPFAQAYGEAYEQTVRDMEVSPIVDIISRHPNVVGGFYGHINSGSSVITTDSGIAFVGVCEELVRPEGQEHGYLACKLPQAGQQPLHTRQEFAVDMASHESRRMARFMAKQGPKVA